MNRRTMIMAAAMFALAAFIVLALPMTDDSQDSYALTANIGGYDYELDESNMTAVAGNTGYKGDVVIPQTVEHEGKTYTVVKLKFTRNNSEVTSFTLPATVTELTYKNISGCNNLTKIIAPGVTKLAPSSISDNYALTEVQFGNLTVLPNDTFKNCKALVTVDLPGTYTKTGTNVFRECTALKTVTLSDTLEYIGAYAFQDTPALDTVTANGVKEVYTAAFKNSAVKTVNFGDMKSIGRMAFNTTPNLTAMNFNKATVEEVGSGAFVGCGYPEPLVFGTTLSFIPASDATEFSVQDGVTIIGSDLFNGNDKIQKVSIASTVEEIGSNVFKDCINLSSVEFRGSSALAKVGDNAFNGDAKLTAIALPAQPIDFGKSVFSGTGLTESVVCEDSTGLVCLVYAHSVPGEYQIAEGVKKVNYGAFEGNTSAGVLINAGVTTLDSYAIAYSDVQKITLLNPDTVMERGCFSNNPKLTQVTLPNELTFIPDSGFTKCTALESITIPDACTKVYPSAFSGCTALKTVVMNGSPFLDRYAFNATGIESVTLRPGMTDGSNAFSKCVNLKTVVLEEGITYIGRGMFSGCTALTSVTLPDSLREIDQSVFSDTGLETLTVPAGVTSVKGFLVNGSSVKSVVFEGSFELTSNNFGNCDNLQFIEFMGQYGSSGRYIFNFTDPFGIKIHNPTAFDDDGFTYRLKNPVSVDEAAGIEYITVTYVRADGTEIEGRYALSCTADTVVLGPQYVGFVPSILDGKQFEIDPANPVIKDDGEAIYADGKLVLLRDCDYYDAAPGTVRLNSYALTGCASLRSLSLPASITSVGTGALLDAAALEEVFMSASVEGLEFPESCKVYYEYGTYDPAVAGDRFDGYFLQLPYGRVILDHAEPTFSVGDMVLTDSTAVFDILPVTGYTDSVCVLTISGIVLQKTSAADNVWVEGQKIDGKYVISDIADDIYIAVSGIQKNVYDISLPSGPGYSASLTTDTADVPYGTEALLQVLLNDGYSVTSGFKVLVNGASVAFDRSNDRGAVISLLIDRDMVITVEGVQQNTEYQVTFDVNGGNAVPPQSVIGGGIAEMTVPVYAGHVFMGWYADQALTQLYDFRNPVNSAVTLYAKWAADTVPSHAVTFASDRGTITAQVNGYDWIVSGESVAEGSTVTFYLSLPMNTDVVSWTAGEVCKDSKPYKTYTVSGALNVSVATSYAVSGSSGYRYDIPVFTEEDYIPLWTVRGGDVGFMGSTIPPAILDDRIYFRSLSEMFMVDANTGEVLKRVETGIKFSGFYAFCSTGNEMVMDGFGGQVYDRDLNLLYTLDVCNIKSFYYQDMIFVPSEGSIYAYSAVDQDPTTPDNIQTPVWVSATDTFDSPYAGGSTVLFQDDWLLTVCLTGGETYLKTVSIDDGSVISSIAIPEFREKAINIGYMDLAEGYATLSVYGSGMFDSDSGDMDNLASVRVDDNGVFNDVTLRVVSTHTGSGYCSALIVSDGLGYIAANGCIQVYDMETMNLLAQSEHNGMYYGHNSMMISDAEPDRVIGYMVSYNSSSSLYGFEYVISENSVRLFELKGAASVPQYSSAIPRMLENGCVIFYNDSNCVFCVAPAVELTLQHNNGLTETFKVAKGSNLDMSGQTFEGVFSDPDMLVPWNMETAINGDTTVYVKHTLEPASIVFSDGTSDILTVSGYVGGPVDGKFPSLSKTGYTAVWKDGTGKTWTSMPAVFDTAGRTVVTLTWAPNNQVLTVLSVDGNGTVLDTSYLGCKFGDSIALADVKADIKDYTFVKADADTITIGADDAENVMVLTYAPYPVITWSVEGSETSVNVAPGSTPVYTGPEPVKESTADKTYTFKGWSPAIVPADKNAVYTAVFEEKVRQYTVTFCGEDGTTVFGTATVDYGTAASIEGAPAKADTQEFTYVFSAWVNIDGTAADLSSVTGDVTVKATYTAKVRQYTVTFCEEDGTTVFCTASVYYGTPAIIEGAPAKEQTQQFSYRFSAWVNLDGTAADLSSVTGDMKVKASYTETVRQYTVSYISEGKMFAGVTVDYGQPAVLEDVPAKESDELYDYAFSAWMSGTEKADLSSVKGDMTVEAAFDSVKKSFTLTYVPENGEASSTVTAAWGTDVVLKDEPAKDHSVFLGWEYDGLRLMPGTEFTMPAEDTVLTGMWKAQVTAEDVTVDEGNSSVDVGSDSTTVSKDMTETMTAAPGASIEMNFTDATVKMSAEALAKLSKDGTGAVKDMTITVVSSDRASEDVLSKVSQEDLALVTYKLIGMISVDVQSSGTTSGLGDVVITVPYQLNGQNPEFILVNYVDDRGELVPMRDVTYADGMLSFTTDHFSDFAISYHEEPAPEKDSTTMYLVCGLIFGIIIGAGALFVFVRTKN